MTQIQALCAPVHENDSEMVVREYKKALLRVLFLSVRQMKIWQIDVESDQIYLFFKFTDILFYFYTSF